MAPKKGMTREEATELYQDLRKAMGAIKNKPSKPSKEAPDKEMQDIAKTIAASISQSMAKDTNSFSKSSPRSAPKKPTPIPRAVRSLAAEETADAITRMEVEGMSRSSRLPSGHYVAVMTVILFALCKVGVSALEAAGIMTVSQAQAALQMVSPPPAKISSPPMSFSKEEFRILTSLDSRRAELEERGRKLDEHEADLAKRDKEFAAKITQLRELSDSLKGEREKNEKKRNNQLEQLANVYGSMAPQEAANLMEQLDVTIALSLLERMPEKRIGQILALMHPERALAMTRMLSGKAGI